MSKTLPEGTTLAQLMSVQPAEAHDIYVGQPETYGSLGIYGGHFLGQALAAAYMTVEEPKLAQSLHGYFINRGDPEQPLLHSVARVREGRGSEVRRVTVSQAERTVFEMMAAFKLPEESDEHQMQAPSVPSAAEVIAAREAVGKPKFPFPIIQGGRAEVEFVSPSFMEFASDQAPNLQLWMRVVDEPSLDERARHTVLAFLSDATLMFNSVLPHGKPMQTHRLTSLDQSVWFHRPTDPTDWLLYDQRSTAAADGRGMNHGEIFDSQGSLIMTCAQESMLRRI